MQRVLRWVARYVGDICWLIRDFPRLSAYRLTGKEWSIVFVGGEHGLLEVQRLFFPEQEVLPEELGRVALWELARRARGWLADGVNLIICELSRIYPGRFGFPITFTIPIWIQQVLPIPDPPEKLLSGRQQDGTRFRINRARKQGIGYCFSQTSTDFDYFYHRMYLPFVTSRHGESALITPYKKQFRRFKRGGILFVIQNNEPVAGSLCYVSGNTCIGVEYGILDNDGFLFQQGISALVVWYTILWGYQRGCKFLNMGGSRAWCSNGAFEHKQCWKPYVKGLNEIYSTWTFLAQELPPTLEDSINQIGFISEIKGRFYRVLIRNPIEADKSFLQEELARAKKQGLAGIVLVSSQRTPVTLE